MDQFFLQVVLYFTIIQSLILAIHFQTIKKENSSRARVLSLLLLVYSLAIIAFQFLDEPTYGFNYYRIIYSLRAGLNCSVFLLLFYYIKILIRNTTPKLKRVSYHLAPVFLIVIVTYAILNSPSNLVAPDYWGWPVLSLLTIAYYTVYLFFIFREIITRHQKKQTNLSLKSIPNLPWLIILLGSFVILWFLEIIVFLFSFSEIIISIIKPLTVIYTVIPFLFVNSILLLALKKPKWLLSANSPILTDCNKANQSKVLMSDITNIIYHQKLYKDPDVDLKTVSKILDKHPRIVSNTINEQMSFPDLINKYRIEEAKRLLLLFSGKTIQEIMFEVGYNSKSTFNHHFKKQTGLTPGEWKNINKK